MTGDLSDTRREYDAGTLSRQNLASDPLAQFTDWLARAQEMQLRDATAMALATVDNTGAPGVRIVLLKHFDADGYVFYTDYSSRKGRELEANPRAELMFYWRELERQVRISGNVARLPRERSEAYFDSRPVDSQISAAASHQSAPIENRAALEAQAQALREAGGVTMPERWGGYVLRPQRYEFWQGRSGRLHDRFEYVPDDGEDAQGWRIQRLQP